MGSIIKELYNKKLLHIPPFSSDTHYEVIMGSIAYGCNEDFSDFDIYSFCFPPKDIMFPHLNGHINNFDKVNNNFESVQEHGVKYNEKEYDVNVYNIASYLRLCMNNNPNMIDSLFVPLRCIIHSTKIGQMIRSFRKEFLYKGCYFKYKGYAYSQLKFLRKKDKKGTREDSIKKYGYDVKFAMNIVRLLNQVEQIIVEHDLDLEKCKEQLKSIRRGEWTEDQIEDYMRKKENQLDKLFHESTLPQQPNYDKIKSLLINCLEEYYGNIDNFHKQKTENDLITDEIVSVLKKYGKV